MPEGRIPLAHATVYLATAPKSNTAYAALGAAMADVENGRTLAVPPHLRTTTRKKLAAASGEPEDAMRYLYSHDYEGAYVPQAYLPEGPDLLSTRRAGHGKTHQGAAGFLAEPNGEITRAVESFGLVAAEPDPRAVASGIRIDFQVEAGDPANPPHQAQAQSETRRGLVSALRRH